MTDIDQVSMLGDMGVSFSGFIFYPRSPRYVLRHLTTSQIKKENRVNKVGVFVNSSEEEVLRMVDECRLQMVQLHGDESPRVCDRLAGYVTVIKAFRLGENEDIPWLVRPYLDCCDMFLFDTMGAGYGGTGKKFDWNVLSEATIGKPFFLSGGIEPGDEEELLRFAESPVARDLFAVDINSKFETSPGIKNMDLVRQFVNRLK